MKAWVLSWDYGAYEGPGEVVRIYLDEQRAKDDMALVDDGCSGKNWHLTEAPIMGDILKGETDE